MEVITLSIMCTILIAGSGVAVYHYEKAIRMLTDELAVSDADIQGLHSTIDKLRATAIQHSHECGQLAAECAELRDALLRQSRDAAFVACCEAAHPGELLRNVYFKNEQVRGIVAKSGVSKSVVQRIKTCKQAVTAAAAYKFEKAYGVSALMLLNMQAKHALQAITCKMTTV